MKSQFAKRMLKVLASLAAGRVHGLIAICWAVKGLCLFCMAGRHAISKLDMLYYLRGKSCMSATALLHLLDGLGCD